MMKNRTLITIAMIVSVAMLMLSSVLLTIQPTTFVRAQDATQQQQTIVAGVNGLFTQTAQVQQTFAATQTIQSAFNQASTATAAFQQRAARATQTVQSAFYQAMTATAVDAFKQSPVAGYLPAMCNGFQKSDCDLLVTAFDPATLSRMKSFSFNFTLQFKSINNNNSESSSGMEGYGLIGQDLTQVDEYKRPVFQLVIKSASSSKGLSDAGEIRIVGGAAFFKFGPEWQEISLKELVDSGSQSVSSNSAAAQTISDADVNSSFARALDNPTIFKAQVADGPIIDGKATRLLSRVLDVLALYKSAEFVPVLEALKKDNPSFNLAQANEFMAAFTQFDLAVAFYVSPDDSFVRAIKLAAVAKQNPYTIQGFSKSPGMNLTIDFTIQLARINQPVSVTRPTGTQKIDSSQLIWVLLAGLSKQSQ